MLIYIIRHGETKANKEGIFQGWSDIPLNEKGIALAEVTGRAMKDIRFDECISSPLVRAEVTARLVLDESGNGSIPITHDERLKEVHMGEWERKNFRTGELDRNEVMTFYREPLKFAGFPGGETLQEVCGRTQSFLNELIERDDGNTYLIATHGCALRAMLNKFYDDPGDFWQGHVPPNCGVSVIEVKDGRAILKENDKTYYDHS